MTKEEVGLTTLPEALDRILEFKNQVEKLEEQNERYRKMIKLLAMEAKLTD